MTNSSPASSTEGQACEIYNLIFSSEIDDLDELETR
jgi:hypothetical protein